MSESLESSSSDSEMVVVMTTEECEVKGNTGTTAGIINNGNELAPVRVYSNEDDEQPLSVVESNLALLNMKKLCDVVFTFQDTEERIEAHQIFLRARSPVFDAMFRGRKIHTDVIEVKIEDEAEPDVFQAFLEFIYGDKFDVDMEGALDLLTLAYKYKVKPLLKKCEDKLKNDIGVRQGYVYAAVDIFEAADQNELPDLKETAGNVIVSKFKVLSAVPEFLEMQESTLIYLLKRDDLAVREIDLFRLVRSWAQKQMRLDEGASEKDILKNILPFVRFPIMSPSEFTSGVVPTQLLSEGDMIAVLSFFTGDLATRARISSSMKFSCSPRKLNNYEAISYFCSSWPAQSQSQKRSNQLMESISMVVSHVAGAAVADQAKDAVLKTIVLTVPELSVNKGAAMRQGLKFNVKLMMSLGKSNSQKRLTLMESVVANGGRSNQEVKVDPPVKLVPKMAYFIVVEDQFSKEKYATKPVVCGTCKGSCAVRTKQGAVAGCGTCKGSGSVPDNTYEFEYSTILSVADLKSNIGLDLNGFPLDLVQIERNSPHIVPQERAYKNIVMIRGIRVAFE